MNGMRALIARWWDNQSEDVQQRVRVAGDGRLPADIARRLQDAGIPVDHWNFPDSSGVDAYVLPVDVRRYLDELDRDDEQGRG
jgi:ribosomal protein S12 methylthiotransferase accessory factor YcaO